MTSLHPFVAPGSPPRATGSRPPVAVCLALAAVSCAALLGHPGAAEARCVGQFVQTWPQDRATGVPTNLGLVVVFGDVGGVAGPLPALRLTSERDRPVPLRVALDQVAGDGVRPQRTLVLVPERALRPTTRYRLAASVGAHGRVRVSFRTALGPDDAPPRLAAVRGEGFGTQELGCGPSQKLALALDGAADDRGAPRLARVRLARSAADLDAGRLVGDVIVPLDEDGRARLGHGMCFGNWPLEPGDRFVARVSVLDAALQESRPLPPIVLDAR